MAKVEKAKKTKVSVFQIEYETSEYNFKVNIAAWTKEDAFGYLSKMLRGTAYKITGFTSVTSIDAITTQVTDDIIKANMPKNKTGTQVPSTPKNEDIKEDTKTTKSTMKKK